MKRTPIFRGALGWNNKVDPVDLVFNAETGMCELAVAHNVDISQRGRVSRRKGHTRIVSLADAHSVFSSAGITLFCAGDKMYRLNEGYTYDILAIGMPEKQRVSYTEVNKNVYMVNGDRAMKYLSATGLVSTFVREGDYVGPTTTRQYTDPPAGMHIAYHRGRLLISVGNVLHFSEPGAYSWFCANYNFRQFDSYIRMIRPLAKGLYVSTETAVYYLHGDYLPEAEIISVASYPALEWSEAYDLFDVSRSKLLLDMNFSGKAGVWMGINQDGQTSICVGGEGGRFLDLTRDKVDAPSSLSGCGLVHDDKYIGLIQP